MPKGEEFFALVVRFRFATGDKEMQKTMESHGFPQKLLKPVNVMTCIASLSTNPAVAHLAPFYDKLCDYSRLLTRLPPPGDSPPKASLNQAIWRCGKAHLVKPTIHGVFGIN